MPKSTVAVSLVAVFLLGLLLGQHVSPRVASAGPTDVSGTGNTTTLLATGQFSEYATLWQVRDGKVLSAVRYLPDGASGGAQLRQVRLELPAGADDKPPK